MATSLPFIPSLNSGAAQPLQQERCAYTMTDAARETPVSALLIGEYNSERLMVHEIFRKCGWRLFEAADRRSALQFLKRIPIRVVIAESNLPRWDWRKVLGDLRSLAFPPQLVVASRTADDHLWAEVLNFGAFDVLMQPFDREEVERVVASASRHFELHHGPARSLALPSASIA
jgi:two-component system, response regulator, stage 0 sporulation protein F